MVKQRWLWLVGSATGLWLLWPKNSTSDGIVGGPDKGLVSRDPSLLLPSFLRKLEILFSRLRTQGFDPILNEGYRSPARAAQLAANAANGGPQAIVDSLHSYGAAADVISASSGWSDPNFFNALGQEAHKLGLTWGGNFSTPDRPHIQAVTVKDTADFKRQPIAMRDTYVMQRGTVVG